MTLFNFTFDLGKWSWFHPKAKVVLVVEDDADTVEMIRRSAEMLGFQVAAASTAEEAIGILHSNGRRFVLTMIDVKLPSIDGWELRRLLHATWPDLPIVVMSGSVESFQDMPRGEKLSVLIKPASYGEFFRSV